MFNWLFGRSESKEKMSAKVEVKEVPPQPELARHDSSVLDLAFAMDCTGSMGSYIRQAQQNIRKIVEEIVSKEKSDVQLALVEYRDHPPQDSSFITRVLDFTPSVSKMKKRLDECNASGGGDAPEAVADALQQVLKLNWREESTKICVFISDAPPHGLNNSGDGFPNGCPLGIDPMEVTRQMAEKNITIYLVGCEPSIVPYKDFFQAVAHITGGQYVPLTNAALLTQVIIGGAQEELSLQRLMEDVNQEVLEEALRRLKAAVGELDEEEISRKVHLKMNKKGVKSRQLQMNCASLPEASAVAKGYAAMANMADVRKQFKSREPEVQEFRGMSLSRCTDSIEAEDSGPSRAMGMMPMAAPSSFGSADSYNVIEQEGIDYVQSKRMVSKAMRKNKLKK